MTPYMMTASRRKIDLIKPRPEDIDLDDIIYSLSNINRFGGHIGGYTVLEHSIHVTNCALSLAGNRVLDYVARAALLHDAHEAYVNDVITPVKSVLGTAFGMLDDRFKDVIADRFDLVAPDMVLTDNGKTVRVNRYVDALIAKADRMVTHAEAVHYLGDEAKAWAKTPWKDFRPWGWYGRARRRHIFRSACSDWGVA